jgi:hypothetical protein
MSGRNSEQGAQLTLRSSWSMGSAPVDAMCPQKPHVDSTLSSTSKPTLMAALEHDIKHSHALRLSPPIACVCDRMTVS